MPLMVKIREEDVAAVTLILSPIPAPKSFANSLPMRIFSAETRGCPAMMKSGIRTILK